MSKHQKELAELPNTLKVQPKLTRESRLSQSILKAVVEVNLLERMLMLILCVQYLSFQHDSQVVRYTKDLCAPSMISHLQREITEREGSSFMCQFEPVSLLTALPSGYLLAIPSCSLFFFHF